jgi:hypothetical protein
MKIIHCDICGKEVKSNSPIVDVWDKKVFIDMDNDPIEDICEECFKILFCCINMMKETRWRPDFHEVLESNDVWKRDKAGYTLCDLEKQTKLKF